MAQSLRVEIVGDNRSYSRALKNASGDTESFGRTIGNLGRVAAVGFAAVGVGVGVVAKKTIEAASDMGETVSKTKTVFGDSGDAVVKWGEALSTSFGISKQEGLDAVAIFGTFGTAAGKTGDELVKFSEPLVKAAADLASFHNVPVAQALEDIRSGLAGEVEPLRKYGILLNDAALRAEAMRQGLVKNTKEALSPQNKELASQALILKKLGPAQGDFARTAGSSANQMRILGANAKNLSAQMGAVLLPVFSKVVTGLANFTSRLQKASGIKAKIKVAADIVWEFAKSTYTTLRKQLSNLLFGQFTKGGGVGPEGIKFNEGLVSQFSGALAALDWTAVGQAVIDGIVAAIQRTGQLAKQLASTITDAIKQVPWEEVGRTLGPGFAAMIAAAFVTLTDPAFWAKNWDLALAIALVAFGGPIAKLGGKLLAPFAKLGGDLVLALAGGIERLSPRLAEAVLAGMQRLGGIISAGFGRLAGLAGTALGALEGIVRGIFGRLGGLAVLLVKVAGIDVAINAIVQFSSAVAGFFSRLAGTVGSALNTAWDAIKKAALQTALAIVEPFSHLPFGLGGWAQKAKESIQQQLDNIDLRAAAKHVEAWGGDLKLAASHAGGQAAQGLASTAPQMKAAGTGVGAAGAQGVTQGIYAWLPQAVAAGVALVDQTISAMRTTAAAKSPSKKTIELGQDLIKGLGIGMKQLAPALAMLGVDITRDLLAALGKGIDKAKTTTVKGLGNAATAIIAAAKKAGVDARAALAVAMTEGGTSFGKTGDSGTSFGPFQLHIGGASPFSDPAKAAAFANSIKGITYALNQMADAGARGKTGFDAIKAIVTSFERPANPSAEIAKAIAYYKEIPKQLDGALEEGGKVTAATILKTLNQLAALVKQYGPQIGRDHAVGIIAGLVGKTGDIVAAAKAQMEKVVAAMAKVTQARTDVKEAFKQMANDALAEFDKVTADWKPPSLTLLGSLQAEDAKADAEKEIQGAADTLRAAQDKLVADLAAGPQPGELPEDYQKRIDEDTAAVEAARLAQGDVLRKDFERRLGEQGVAEQTAWDNRRAKIRENLQLDLVAIGEELDKQPPRFGKTQREIITTLKRYHIPMQTAGKKIAEMFGGGLGDGLVSVIDALHKLTAAIEGVARATGTKIPPQDGGGGPQRPPDVGGRGTSAMNVTVNMPNYLGDKREAAQTIRQELQRIGRDNAVNPLAV